jgi:uncharacterized protein YbjT (DUF2867 family)
MNLILGASGTLGSRIASRLLARGEEVRAVSRDPARLAELERLGAHPLQGDLRTSEWMPAALDGVRSLVLSTHGLVPPTRDNHPGIVDETGNQRIIDAAVRAGVPHVVLVSATSSAGSPTLFGQSKYRTEQYLVSAGIAYTIIRPTVFIETHAIRLLAQPLRESGSVLIFGSGTPVLNWVSADDVADCIVETLLPATSRNVTVTVGGIDNLSRLDVVAIVEKMLGRTARRRHVPVPVLRAMRRLAGPFHPGMKYLLDMAIQESESSNDPGWAPRSPDWLGPTSVGTVLHRWANDRSTTPSSSS